MLRYLPRTFYALLSVAFLISFLVTLWMVFYFPVNPDEIFWKLMIARLESDHGKLVYLFAQCRQGQWIDAPLTWYPAMAINSWLYEDASHPWELRIHGWILFLVLLGLWSWLLNHRAGLGWSDSFLAVSAFLSAGVLPFLMVYERPEQPLLLLVTLALVVTLFQAPERRLSWGAGLLMALGFVLVATLLSALHPKGMFLLPVLLVLAWRQLKSLPLMAVLVLLMGWTAYDTLQVWQLRTTCPEFPGLMKVLQNLTLRPSLLISDPFFFIRTVWSNFLGFGAYVTSLEFRGNYVSNWLPAVDGALISAQVFRVANALLWVPPGIAVLVMAANWFSDRRPRGWIDGLLWLSLLLALSAIVVLQTQKNFYEVSFIWPLVLLVAIFSFGQPVRRAGLGSVRFVIGALMLVALLSGGLRLERFGEFVPVWRQARVEQTARADLQNEALRQFARLQCQINDSAPRLVLDKNTYQAFWNHEQPIFLDYASGWWATESNIEQTFRQRRAQGLVAHCENVPEPLRSKTVEFDGYCCISADSLR